MTDKDYCSLTDYKVEDKAQDTAVDHTENIHRQRLVPDCSATWRINHVPHHNALSANVCLTRLLFVVTIDQNQSEKSDLIIYLYMTKYCASISGGNLLAKGRGRRI